jgi:hypothetical protein
MSRHARYCMATNQSKPNPASDLFSEKQAADYLHQKPRTIRDWRTRRALPCFKPTAKVTLFRKADLDAWLDRHRVATVARHSAPASPGARPSCQAAARQGGAQ